MTSEEWKEACEIDEAVEAAGLDWQNKDDWEEIAKLTGETLPWQE